MSLKLDTEPQPANQDRTHYQPGFMNIHIRGQYQPH